MLTTDPHQLRFDVALVGVADRTVSPKIKTPVLRWRKTVRLFDPPPDSRCSRKSFQAVASALADYADRNGSSCWPAVGTIAADTDYSPRQVQYALTALEERGLIVRQGTGGRGRTTRYELICRRVEKAVDAPVDAEQLEIETAQAETPKGCDPSHPRSAKEDRPSRERRSPRMPLLWKLRHA